MRNLLRTVIHADYVGAFLPSMIVDAYRSGRRQRRTRQGHRDDILDVGRGALAYYILSLQRWYCKRIAVNLSRTPRMVNLREASRSDDDHIHRTALTDQAAIYDSTAHARAGFLRAVRLWMILATSMLLAASIAMPGIFAISGWAIEALTLIRSEPAAASRYWRWEAAVTASGLHVSDLAIGLAVGLVWTLLVAVFIGISIRRSISQIRRFHIAMRKEVHDRLLAANHEILNRARERLLYVRTAPGLSGNEAGQVLDRSELTRIRALVFDLDANAIAISGGRGVGKTTLLRMLGDRHGESYGRAALVVDAAAPVKYQAREFLLHLYGELARRVLAEVGSSQRRARLLRAGDQLRNVAANALLISGFLILYAVLLPSFAAWLREHWVPIPRNPAVAVLLCVTLWWLCRLLGTTRGVPDGRLAVEARRRIQQTRFLQTLTLERNGSLGLGRLQLGRRWARQLSEQPLTMPELVASYRQFAAMVAAWWRDNRNPDGKLVIAIDEIDRIVSAEYAEEFLNEVKAVFGVENCVHVVSVSEEALANFERRVARVRTVFDSAFDEIIRLRPFTARESVELLRRRLAGVPDRFLLLCHCLGGGMPRDVVQMARTMLDVHRERLGGSSLADISQELITREVAAVKRGFLWTGHDYAAPPELAATISADEAWPGTTGKALCLAAGQVIAHERKGRERNTPLTVLGAALYFYATVLDVFVAREQLVRTWERAVRRASMLPQRPDAHIFEGHDVRRWLYGEDAVIRDPDQRKDPLEAIYALDLARQMLPANPSSAIAKLTTIRTRLRLELPGFAYGGPAEPQTWPASPARPINDRFTRTTFSRDGAPVRA